MNPVQHVHFEFGIDLNYDRIRRIFNTFGRITAVIIMTTPTICTQSIVSSSNTNATTIEAGNSKEERIGPMPSSKYGINNEYITSGKTIENSAISTPQPTVAGVVGAVINCGAHTMAMSMKAPKHNNHVFDSGSKLLPKLAVNCIVQAYEHAAKKLNIKPHGESACVIGNRPAANIVPINTKTILTACSREGRR